MTRAITQSIGERRHTLWTVLLLLVAAALFAALGRWQLERAEAQRLMESEALAAEELPPLELRASPIHEHDVYRRAVAEGTYDPTQQFYLEGRQYQGRIGYHVVTALRLMGTRRYVLVNRGWIPETVSVAPVPAGRVRVSGLLTKAQLPPLRIGQPQGVTRPYLDPRDYARESGRPVEPLLLLAAEGDGGVAPAAFERESKQGMHEGYAIQWFSFAVIAFVAAAMTVLRQVRQRV